MPRSPLEMAGNGAERDASADAAEDAFQAGPLTVLDIVMEERAPAKPTKPTTPPGPPPRGRPRRPLGPCGTAVTGKDQDSQSSVQSTAAPSEARGSAEGFAESLTTSSSSAAQGAEAEDEEALTEVDTKAGLDILLEEKPDQGAHGSSPPSSHGATAPRAPRTSEMVILPHMIDFQRILVEEGLNGSFVFDGGCDPSSFAAGDVGHYVQAMMSITHTVPRGARRLRWVRPANQALHRSDAAMAENDEVLTHVDEAEEVEEAQEAHEEQEEQEAQEAQVEDAQEEQEDVEVEEAEEESEEESEEEAEEESAEDRRNRTPQRTAGAEQR